MRRPGALWRQVMAMPRARIILYLCLLAAYLIVFTVIVWHVFPLWEGRTISWEEAVLFVMETITTVGYGDLLPFRSGYMILLAILMIASGVFLIFMLIPLLLAPAISEHLRAEPPGVLPSPLKGHVVIVGPGEMIRSLIESLTIADLPIVIVEEQTLREGSMGDQGRLCPGRHLEERMHRGRRHGRRLRTGGSRRLDHPRDQGDDPGADHRRRRHPGL